MTWRSYGADAGGDLVLVLDEGHLFLEGRDVCRDQFGGILGRTRQALGRRPETILRLADDVAGIGEGGLAVRCHAANVIGVAMGDHHHVDLVWRDAGRREALRQLAARCSTQPGVEEHQFLAGVDDDRHEHVHGDVGGKEVAFRRASHILPGFWLVPR